MSGKTFTAKLYKDMGWDTNCRYKILGYKITADGQTIYIFDLSETEIFVDPMPSRTKKKKSKNADKTDADEKVQQGSSSSEEPSSSQGSSSSEEPSSSQESSSSDGPSSSQESSSSQEPSVSQESSGETPASRKRRPGFFPEDWENSYGLPVGEHDNYRQINLKEGYESVSSDKPKEGDHNGEPKEGDHDDE